VTADAGDRVLDLLAQFEAVADEVTPDEAARTLDAATLQMFWRHWPQISSWGGALWRKLDRDLDDASHPAGEAQVDEGGGG
jgi:hypothetical protein